MGRRASCVYIHEPYIYICNMHIHTYTYNYICIYIRTHIRNDTSIERYVDMHKDMINYVCVCVYRYMSMSVYDYVCTCVYIQL